MKCHEMVSKALPTHLQNIAGTGSNSPGTALISGTRAVKSLVRAVPTGAHVGTDPVPRIISRAPGPTRGNGRALPAIPVPTYGAPLRGCARVRVHVCAQARRKTTT